MKDMLTSESDFYAMNITLTVLQHRTYMTQDTVRCLNAKRPYSRTDINSYFRHGPNERK